MAEKRKIRPPRIRQLIPNLITVFVICAGLTSVRFGMDGKYGLALMLILLSAILDAADGRIARALDSVSDLGAELDSLADFFNFGIAPGLLLYFAIFSDTEFANLGWLAVLALAVACALRLARFNVALDQVDEPLWKAGFFVGVPAPAMGTLALLPMFLIMLGHDEVKSYPEVIFFYLIVVALLAVSRIPTFSIKYLRLPPDSFLPIMILGGGFIASLVVYTWQTIIAGEILYLLSIPLSARVYLKRRKTEGDEI